MAKGGDKVLNGKLALVLILVTVLLSIPMPVDARRIMPPEIATFEILFIGPDVVGGPFTTEANAEDWEPTIVRGKGRERMWQTELCSMSGMIYIVDAQTNLDAPEPTEEYGAGGSGYPDYMPDTTIWDLFGMDRPIEISWIGHRFSRDYDYWTVMLSQENSASGRTYTLKTNDGVGEYDPSTDTWTVEFTNAYSWIWWYELESRLYHQVWKGYLTFTVTIQKVSWL